MSTLSPLVPGLFGDCKREHAYSGYVLCNIETRTYAPRGQTNIVEKRIPEAMYILHKLEQTLGPGYNLSPSNPKGEISFSNLPVLVTGRAAYVTRDAYVSYRRLRT